VLYLDGCTDRILADSDLVQVWNLFLREVQYFTPPAAGGSLDQAAAYYQASAHLYPLYAKFKAEKPKPSNGMEDA
jgi:hypothetical protein